MSGDHDHRRRHALLLEVLQNFNAVEHRHLDVEKDGVVRDFGRLLDPILTGARFVDAVTLVLQGHADGLADRGLVVDD